MAEPFIVSVSPRVSVDSEMLDVFFNTSTTLIVNIFSAVLPLLSLTTALILYDTADPGVNVTDVVVVFSVFAVQDEADSFF